MTKFSIQRTKPTMQGQGIPQHGRHTLQCRGGSLPLGQLFFTRANVYPDIRPTQTNSPGLMSEHTNISPKFHHNQCHILVIRVWKNGKFWLLNFLKILQVTMFFLLLKKVFLPKLSIVVTKNGQYTTDNKNFMCTSNSKQCRVINSRHVLIIDPDGYVFLYCQTQV